MSEVPEPEISLIYVTASDLRPLAAVLRRLAEQTIARHVEILVVAPDPSMVAIPVELSAPFHSLRILTEQRRWIGAARAAGVRAACAPIVAFGEDHAYPSPRWLEELLRHHRAGAAVVGPAMRNENPQTARSWASFVLAYGRFADPVPPGSSRSAPGHNSSYLREALLRFDAELATLLDAETIVQWQFAEEGMPIIVAPAAVVSHINISSAAAFLPARYYGSRLFAAVWSRHWSWPRRFKFALLAPGIALRRTAEVAEVLRRLPKGTAQRWRLWPLLAVSLGAVGVGYAVGFLFGRGKILARIYSEEVERGAYLRSVEREVMERERAASYPLPSRPTEHQQAEPGT